MSKERQTLDKPSVNSYQYYVKSLAFTNNL